MSESKKSVKRAHVVRRFEYNGPGNDQFFEVCVKSDDSRCVRCRDPKNPRKFAYGFDSIGLKNTIYDYKCVQVAIQKQISIFICPDEDAVVSFKALGMVATTCYGGYGRWSLPLCEMLKGARQVVLMIPNDPGADRVEPGEPFWVSQKKAVGLLKGFELAGVPATAFILPDVAGMPCVDVSTWVGQFKEYRSLVDVIRAAPPFPQKYFEAISIEKAPEQPEHNEKSLSDRIGLAVWEASKTDDGKNRTLSVGERRKILNKVVFDWLLSRGQFFYNIDFLKYDFNMYFDSTDKELHIMESNMFQSWLSLQSNVSRANKDFTDCMNFLHDQALCGPETKGVIPSKFFHRKDNVIYISNGDRHVVRVSDESVKLVDNGTDGVVFSTGETLAEWKLLPDEKRMNPFENCIIFKTMPVKDDYGKLLLLLWILGVLYCHEKKPPIVAAGEVGSGKTRLFQAVFELLGMAPRINMIDDSKSNAQENFWVSMNYHGMICWDNVDTKIRWLPDALSSASTNGLVEVREKYSNDKIYFHRANANVMITSANATFAGDAGLADRLITIRIGRLINETDDGLLADDIKDKRDGALSWLCQVLSAALADKKPVPKGLNRRHPDWAEFAVRCGRALNCESQTIAALQSAEQDKSKFAIENNWVGQLLSDVLPPGVEWQGTSQELVNYIIERGDLNEKQKKNLSAKSLGNQMRSIWPHLEHVFNASKRIKTGRTQYTLVGLVGFKVDNRENPQKEECGKFNNNNPPNPPNPPNNETQKKKEESYLSSEEIEDLEGLGSDGWEE